jgi:hypothetical protein
MPDKTPTHSPALDPEGQYTATLTGMQWVSIMSLLMGTGARLTQATASAEQREAGDLLLDTGIEIIKQIDPDGWAETDTQLGDELTDAERKAIEALTRRKP